MPKLIKQIFPVANLKVGDWVVIVKSLPKVITAFGDGYGVSEKKNHIQSYGGSPAKIVAINLPFLAVIDGDSGGSIDTRRHCLIKCNQEYVDAMLQIRELSLKEDKGEFLKLTGLVERQEKRKKKRARRAAKKDQSFCPKCGVKRRQLSHGNGWYWHCDQCDGTDKIGATL